MPFGEEYSNIQFKGYKKTKLLEIYRNVKMTESTFDKLNEIATNEGRSFAVQAGIFMKQGMIEYTRRQK